MEELNETTEKSNVKLAYEYTESALKDINASLDHATTKLTAILAFSGVLLRFTIDLESKGYFFISKFLICSLAALTIGFCGKGLLAEPTGDIIRPEECLKPEWYRASEEKFQLYIVRQWIECFDQLNKLLVRRTIYLNCAIRCLVIASIIFAFSIVQDQIPQILEFGLRELETTIQKGLSGLPSVLEFLAGLPHPKKS